MDLLDAEDLFENRTGSPFVTFGHIGLNEQMFGDRANKRQIVVDPSVRHLTLRKGFRR